MADEDFAWTELGEVGWKRRSDEEGVGVDGDALRRDTYRMFKVQVDSRTDIGREMLKNPIAVLRREVKIPEMEIPEDVRAMVLRVNAEVPANPKHRSYLFAAYEGSMTLIGLQFKYEESE
jgi:hypothetical protein